MRACVFEMERVHVLCGYKESTGRVEEKADRQAEPEPGTRRVNKRVNPACSSCDTPLDARESPFTQQIHL